MKTLTEKKRITIYDVARESETSIATVSKALNGKTDISEETRKRILDVVDRLGFSVNKTASSIPRKPINIVTLVPDTLNSYMLDALYGIEHEQKLLKDYKISTDYYLVPNNTHSFMIALRQFHKMGYDGVIIIPPKDSDKFSSELESSRIHESFPIITATTDIKTSLRIFCTQCNALTSGKMAAELLGLSLNSGKVAHVTGSINVTYQKINADGFCSYLNNYNLEFIGNYEHFNVQDKAILLADRLMQEHPDLNGVYLSTSISTAFIDRMKELGAFPQVKIVASDIFPKMLDYIRESTVVASIFQSPQKQGRLALRYMFEYLTGQKDISDNDPYIFPQPILGSNVEYFEKFILIDSQLNSLKKRIQLFNPKSNHKV